MPTKINIPDGAARIIAALQGRGYEAYAVGGCVRDSLLGKIPKDWDITTSAPPNAVAAAFRRKHTIPTGVRHGTVTVLSDGGAYEVTTFRVDGKYSDGRRPDAVRFADSLEEDLSRRDFTVNAMAYNGERGLVDVYDGRGDLSRRVIRCVGDASERFGEDYLRMLRAYRFAATLGFSIDPSARGAAEKLRTNITKVSAERIREEFVKLVMSMNMDMTRLFFEDFGSVLFPEVYRLRHVRQRNRYHKYDAFEHTLAALSACPADLEIRLAALLHDTGKFETETTDEFANHHYKGHQRVSARIAADVMSRLKFDNATSGNVVTLTRFHDDRFRAGDRALRRFIARLGPELARKCLLLQYADSDAHSDYARAFSMPQIAASLEMFDEVLAGASALTVKQLAVNGGDIMESLGIGPGRAVGEILGGLLAAVVDDPSLNERGTLIEMAKANLSSIEGE
ncbi:MAG: HD domain-containing protein [Clostridiales bacterium]|jgi:tRNA nucleotidyltransferase (CCA-adding enzyme)|nr:HD domain-containing protein [Clostridiales bacterium]